MKTFFLHKVIILSFLFQVSCMDSFLDREPLSSIAPESYLFSDVELETYALNMYNANTLPSHYGPGARGFGMMGVDEHTDNMASLNYSLKYVPGEYKVPSSGGEWNFSNIYNYNYFLQTVLPRWEQGELTGSENRIRHAIGEVYFFRAWEYFRKVQALGDFPIVTHTLRDQSDELIEASRRMPRTTVIRFILDDLDKAIEYMQENSPDGAKNRLSKACAQLVKSRVALYEATWLKYFKGTAFVPNGANWPGKAKDYNSSFEYPSGNIDNEIDWLFSIAMENAALVADKFTLVQNNGILKQSLNDQSNDYYDMFSNNDLSKYSEVLLWRKYDAYGVQVRNNVSQYASVGNYRIGLTRGYVDSYLMNNGLPIYAAGSGYSGDDLLSNVRKNRDGRLWLFLKEPGQANILIKSNLGDINMAIEEGVPNLTHSSEALAYFTGYSIRKGLNNNEIHAFDVGSVVFRATEAYLNYIEACYERTGAIDSKADKYWKQIRKRALVEENYNITIAATDMTREAHNDWAAYSAGQLVDPTLYNIRRERRCEFLGEGFRHADLKRWRSMDQMISDSYHIEGFKLWGAMKEWYRDTNGNLILVYGTADANVSHPDLSNYLRPYQKTGKELVYQGYKWAMAHYLEPIALQHFLITTSDSHVDNSSIYQNPGWPIAANVPPIDL